MLHELHELVTQTDCKKVWIPSSSFLHAELTHADFMQPVDGMLPSDD